MLSLNKSAVKPLYCPKMITEKFNILIIILFCCIITNCTQNTLSTDCNLPSLDDTLKYHFAGQLGQDVRASPFRNGKIILSVSDSLRRRAIELDLITGDIESLSPGDWRTKKSKKTPIYKDIIDSVVWVGGPNRKLIRYNHKLNNSKRIYPKYVIDMGAIQIVASE